MNATGTSWIVAGAEVLVYVPNTRDGNTDPRRTTIKTVAAKSFTVESGGALRFDLATQEYRSAGISVHAYDRRVVPLDSDEARHVLAAAKRRQATYAARVACSTYDQQPTREHRLAAIAALQAVED